VVVEVLTASGTHTARALIDTGADINLILQTKVIEWELDGHAVAKPIVKFLDQNPMTIYGAVRLNLTVRDHGND